MGTWIQITVLAPDTPETLAAIDLAFAEMQRLEEVLSEWLPTSEISQINIQAGLQPVIVSEDTLRVVQAGLDVARWSHGAFDLSWAALRGMYLFQEGSETIPTRSALDKRLPLIDHTKIIIDKKKRSVFLARKGMLIGTGGIAKGYALDRAGEILQAAGIDHYMLFGGGQVQVLGMKGDRPWRVGIQHPRENDYFAFLEVDHGSISTSGDYEHAFFKDGVRWHHLLDLSTGLPIDHTTSVSVLADSGLYADAVSTAVFAMGTEKALSSLEAAPGGARFVVVDKGLRVSIGGDLREQLVFTRPLDGQNRILKKEKETPQAR